MLDQVRQAMRFYLPAHQGFYSNAGRGIGCGFIENLNGVPPNWIIVVSDCFFILSRKSSKKSWAEEKQLVQFMERLSSEGLPYLKVHRPMGGILFSLPHSGRKPGHPMVTRRQVKLKVPHSQRVVREKATKIRNRRAESGSIKKTRTSSNSNHHPGKG